MINENNSNCCKCTDPEYILELNEQGPQGRQGKQGIAGVSPLITEETNDYNTYTLKIVDANGEFVTPNLKYPTIPSGGVEGQLLAKGSGGDGSLVWDTNSYVTNEYLLNYLVENYVTLTTDQTIEGSKSFENYLTITEEANVTDTGKLKIKLADDTELSAIQGSQLTSANRIMVGDDNANLVLKSSNDLYAYLNGSSNTVKIISANDKATTDALGIVKPDGTTITVDENGVISGSNQYELPIASTDTLGGIKVGSDLSIAEDGTLTTNIDTSNLVDITSTQTITGTKTFSNTIYGIGIALNSVHNIVAYRSGVVYLGDFDYATTIQVKGNVNVLRDGSTSVILDTGNISDYIDGTNIQWVDNKLTCNLDELGNEVNTVAGDLTTLTTKVETNTSDIATIKEQLEQSNELVAGTNISIVEDTTAGTTTINCTLDTSSLSSNVTSLTSRVDTLETTMATKADITTVTELQTALDTANTTISDLQTQLEAALTRITALETTIDGGTSSD